MKKQREETNQAVQFNFKRCGPMPVPFIIIMDVSGGGVSAHEYITYQQ